MKLVVVCSIIVIVAVGGCNTATISDAGEPAQTSAIDEKASCVQVKPQAPYIPAAAPVQAKSSRNPSPVQAKAPHKQIIPDPAAQKPTLVVTTAEKVSPADSHEATGRDNDGGIDVPVASKSPTVADPVIASPAIRPEVVLVTKPVLGNKMPDEAPRLSPPQALQNGNDSGTPVAKTADVGKATEKRNAKRGDDKDTEKKSAGGTAVAKKTLATTRKPLAKKPPDNLNSSDETVAEKQPVFGTK